MEKVCSEPISPRSFSPTPLKTEVAAHSLWPHSTLCPPVRAPLLLLPCPSVSCGFLEDGNDVVTLTPGAWGVAVLSPQLMNTWHGIVQRLDMANNSQLSPENSSVRPYKKLLV